MSEYHFSSDIHYHYQYDEDFHYFKFRDLNDLYEAWPEREKRLLSQEQGMVPVLIDAGFIEDADKKLDFEVPVFFHCRFLGSDDVYDEWPKLSKALTGNVHGVSFSLFENNVSLENFDFKRPVTAHIHNSNIVWIDNVRNINKLVTDAHQLDIQNSNVKILDAQQVSDVTLVKCKKLAGMVSEHHIISKEPLVPGNSNGDSLVLFQRQAEEFVWPGHAVKGKKGIRHAIEDSSYHNCLYQMYAFVKDIARIEKGEEEFGYKNVEPDHLAAKRKNFFSSMDL